MTIDELKPGKLYLLDSGEVVEFSRVGATGLAIFHRWGEPDAQSSFGVRADRVVREANEEESRRAKE